MQDLIPMAVSRGARTVWITLARQGPQGTVYDELPPYWTAMVTFVQTV
jgi:hypothetical protein